MISNNVYIDIWLNLPTFTPWNTKQHLPKHVVQWLQIVWYCSIVFLLNLFIAKSIFERGSGTSYYNIIKIHPTNSLILESAYEWADIYIWMLLLLLLSIGCYQCRVRSTINYWCSRSLFEKWKVPLKRASIRGRNKESNNTTTNQSIQKSTFIGNTYITWLSTLMMQEANDL